MRLLNTTDLTFTDWEVTELPGYAILSHVWQEEEVLYKDMIEKSAENKKGYAKVVNTCKQAVKDGYNWVWIDSCCINKVDGAELSEGEPERDRESGSSRIAPVKKMFLPSKR